MPTTFLDKELEPFGGNYSHLALGLGSEAEAVQRAAKAQVMRNLPDLTLQIEKAWNIRDKEYAEIVGASYEKLELPKVEKKNFFTGVKPSLIEAPLDLWPNITIYCHDFTADPFQADLYDTIRLKLFIEILCKAGPAKKENIHKREGIEIEQELDSKLQRLTDAVHMCIKKDASLGGVLVGQIEKPPTSVQSLPWVRNEEGNSQYILQGKQLEYTVQKNSF